jgi:hypothetical protein
VFLMHLVFIGLIDQIPDYFDLTPDWQHIWPAHIWVNTALYLGTILGLLVAGAPPGAVRGGAAVEGHSHVPNRVPWGTKASVAPPAPRSEILTLQASASRDQSRQPFSASKLQHEPELAHGPGREACGG